MRQVQERIIINLHHIIPLPLLSRHIAWEHLRHAGKVFITLSVIHILDHINHMEIAVGVILPFQKDGEHFILRGRLAQHEAHGYGVVGGERVVFVGFAENGTRCEAPPCCYLLLTQTRKLREYHADVDADGGIFEGADHWRR